MNPFVRSILVLGLTMPAMSQAAVAAASVGCTMVVGGGRAQPSSDPLINDRWNRLNFSFFDAAAEAMRADEAVEQAYFSVTSADAARNLDTVLTQANKAGCTRVAFFSVFGTASKDEPELVFSLRVSPVGGKASASASATIGAPDYEKEYRFSATPESFDKVVPSRIADQAVRDYRARRQVK